MLADVKVVHFAKVQHQSAGPTSAQVFMVKVKQSVYEGERERQDERHTHTHTQTAPT